MELKMETRKPRSKNNSLKQHDILKNIPLFSCLNDEEISILSQIAVERTYLKNTIIITEGDASTSLYAVCSGKANAISISPDGRQIILNTFRSGDYFGEMSFIDAEPRCATVETRKLTRMLILSRDQFSHILLSNPETWERVRYLGRSEVLRFTSPSGSQPPARRKSPPLFLFSYRHLCLKDKPCPGSCLPGLSVR